MDSIQDLTPPPFPGIIQSIDEIRADIGEAHPAVQKKVINQVDAHARAFIAKSPLFYLSTSHANGLCDVSPRGDSAGFVRVLDEHRLIYPERLGNRRLDSMQNMLTNPQVGLLFIIPGVDVVLRVNGRAWLTKDEELLSTMQLNGKSPIAAVGVEVQECFIHCSRALKLSKIWDSTTWVPEKEHPDSMEMFRAHLALNGVPLEE
ncbi:MSMEG_1061 family FMN-dependent PPOX-type flavoprotein [Paenibacillus qinlingensis]|uniref:PPOX class probable FMN-dependent enzyme n=1 Tax=Paenibacillus qinlingensis TaxID=1837343 RepID=A0ABU1P515_9BACL|nr:MSMEG_1061 family FMN-dependent PPOX-type flavoprotein [Paenibacillus qinlingensis]MDR6554451.1 PPOX class probable FMN-dependent enzyme [Paenibacillus qinlingensis]